MKSLRSYFLSSLSLSFLSFFSFSAVLKWQWLVCLFLYWPMENSQMISYLIVIEKFCLDVRWSIIKQGKYYLFMVIIEKRRFISFSFPILPRARVSWWRWEYEKKKKTTPLFEQDSGMYMSISFHPMR